MTTLARRDETREFIGVVIHTVGTFIAAIAVVILFASSFTPAVLTKTTSHSMPYIPANYEEVAGVTNVFSERQRLGGAGGVGFPQIERTLEKYEENERSTTHFLVVSPGEVTYVDYYDFQPEKVIHAGFKETSVPPVYEKFGITFGSYIPRSGTIENGELVLERKFIQSGWAFIATIVFMLVGAVLYLIAVKPLLNHVIIDPIYRRILGR